MAMSLGTPGGVVTQKSIKARARNNQLNGRIRIFAILWFVLVAVTLICLVFLFQNVMNYSSANEAVDGVMDHMNDAKSRGEHVKLFVQDMLSKREKRHSRSRTVKTNTGESSHAEDQRNNSLGDASKNNSDAARYANIPKPNIEDAVTVAFAVSVTGCGSDPLTEGAAVLKHSIHRASIRGDLGGRYNYKMYAIFHPQAVACAKTLEALGYELLERETFVKVADIEGEFLRKNIEKNGCCGEKEFIKLEAYTLTQHPIVVHLDLDVLVLKPLDSLFDVMMSSTGKGEEDTLDVSHIEPMWPATEGGVTAKQVNAFFTRDYNMVNAKKKYKPVQGGFLVLRPSTEVYNEFKSIALKGDFRQNGGWGGLVGPFYGSMTFQGIMPYYYDVLHPGQAIELNRCKVNNMCDNPRDKKTVNDVVHGNCRTGEDQCEDCRSRELEDILTTHYTLCQKPWLCFPHDHDMIQHRLCRKLHHEWFRIRSELESSWGRSGQGPGKWQQDQFLGYCNRAGNKGYVPIATPYGGVAR